MNVPPTATPVVNLALLRGTVTADPVARDLPSGGVVVQFDVRTGPVGGRSAAVPIAWSDPSPRALAPIVAGVDVVVVGAVVRRFFRVGGATQSRTEVVPVAVVPARRAKQVAATVDRTVRRVVEALRAPSDREVERTHRC